VPDVSLIAEEHAPPWRGWLFVLAFGCVLITLTLIIAALGVSRWSNPGWPSFALFVLVLISGVRAGSIAVLVGAGMLPERKSWRGVVLLAWGLVALAAPPFGIALLLQLSVLGLMLPLVIGIVLSLLRRACRPQAA
jgi:hypothetical protein